MTKIIRWLLIIFTFILVGCPPGYLGQYQYTHRPMVSAQHPETQIFPVYLDWHLGEADKISIQVALDQWNYVFNGHFQFVIQHSSFDPAHLPSLDDIPAHALYIRIIAPDDSLTRLADGSVQTECHGNPQGYSLAFTYVGDRYLYLVRQRMSNSQITDVVKHEIGHALGAQHATGGLMSPTYTPEQYRCVDYSTVQQVAAYQHWKVADLNYCQLEGQEGIATVIPIGLPAVDPKCH